MPRRVGNLRRLRSEILLNLQDLDGSQDDEIEAAIESKKYDSAMIHWTCCRP